MTNATLVRLLYPSFKESFWRLRISSIRLRLLLFVLYCFGRCGKIKAGHFGIGGTGQAGWVDPQPLSFCIIHKYLILLQKSRLLQ